MELSLNTGCPAILESKTLLDCLFALPHFVSHLANFRDLAIKLAVWVSVYPSLSLDVSDPLQWALVSP